MKKYIKTKMTIYLPATKDVGIQTAYRDTQIIVTTSADQKQCGVVQKYSLEPFNTSGVKLERVPNSDTKYKLTYGGKTYTLVAGVYHEKEMPKKLSSIHTHISIKDKTIEFHLE